MSSNLRTRAAPLLLLAGLLLLPALAAAQGAPDTILVRVNMSTPLGGGIHAGPLAAPDPILPNPAYSALSAAPQPPAAVPLTLEDNPQGLYILGPSGAPIQVVGWNAGLEQRRVAPVEIAVNALHLRYELPVSVDGRPASPLSFGFQGRIGAPPSSPAFRGDTGTAGTTVAVVGDEVVPRDVPSVGSALTPTQYQSFMAAPVAVARDAPAPAPADTAAASAEAVVAVLAAGATLLAVKLLLPLYHRFKKKTALDNPTRQRIYALVREAPGSSAAELGDRAGLHVTTVKYHLDVLRRVSLVGEQLVDGRRRFFCYENSDPAETLRRALLDEPAARAVYQQIATHPGLPFIEVARSLGMRKEHVHYHVQKLARHGLIADKWEGGRRLLFVPPTPGATASPATEVEG